MQGWQTPYLGLREIPHDLSGFDLQAFFTFSLAERELIEARRGDLMKLGLALHIGFLRMSGGFLPFGLSQRRCGATSAPNSASTLRRLPRCAPCMAEAAPCSTTNKSPATPSGFDG